MTRSSSPSDAPLLIFDKGGLYCEAGNFYIDPSRAVENAIVTHAHSDHARKGSRHYYCASKGMGLLKCRLGKSINVTGIPFGEEIRFGQVRVSLHPAGHILGSAQVRVQLGSRVWVASGDYKREPDPTCDPFEIVRCETFVTEATFGTPSFVWNKSRELGREIHAWWSENARQGRNSVLFGYSLGKAQRILGELHAHAHRPILIHETVTSATECYREEGIRLAPTEELGAYIKGRRLEGELILAPPSLESSEWAEGLGEYRTAFASGWMQGGSRWGRGSYDHGFVMSDHADWNDLNRTIRETGAREVYVMHRGNGALVRHLREQGLEAHPITELGAAALSERRAQLSLF